MCRLVVYKGKDPILLAHLLTRPAHSIIKQSYASKLRIDLSRGPINADGFGVGWYDSPSPSTPPTPPTSDDDDDPTGCSGCSDKRRKKRELELESEEEERGKPCIFNSIVPAWNNENLSRLAEKIRSPLVFAHVRASTSGALSEQNCHPFSFGRLMWMHNGGIADFPKIRRRLQESLPEKLFLFPAGTTDSEWSFALFLSFLPPRLLFPTSSTSSTTTSSDSTTSSTSSHTSPLPSAPPPSSTSPFTPQMLQEAMLKTIHALNEFTQAVGAKDRSLMNFCVSDGESVVAVRYIDSKTEEGASLFFSTGTSFTESASSSSSAPTYRMSHSSLRPDPLVLIASEPLTYERADWMEIPNNTMVVVTPRLNLLQIPVGGEFSR